MVKIVSQVNNTFVWLWLALRLNFHLNFFPNMKIITIHSIIVYHKKILLQNLYIPKATINQNGMGSQVSKFLAQKFRKYLLCFIILLRFLHRAKLMPSDALSTKLICCPHIISYSIFEILKNINSKIYIILFF